MTRKNTQNSKPKAKRQRVLEGHRRRGKRFVPPFLEYMNLSETSWLDDLLPELIWIGLIMDRFDKKRGAKLCVELAKAASACSDAAPGAFAFVSEYTRLSSGEKQCVIDQLTQSGVFNEFGDALRVLAVYYPECPLSFIWSQQEPPTDDVDSLRKLKVLIGELANRLGNPATFVQATAVYVYFLTNKLKVFEGSALADFTAIEDYPNTEASEKVAAMIRALITGSTGPLDLSADWRNYFWNRGLNIELCEGIENGGE